MTNSALTSGATGRCIAQIARCFNPLPGSPARRSGSWDWDAGIGNRSWLLAGKLLASSRQPVFFVLFLSALVFFRWRRLPFGRSSERVLRVTPALGELKRFLNVRNSPPSVLLLSRVRAQPDAPLRPQMAGEGTAFDAKQYDQKMGEL